MRNIAAKNLSDPRYRPQTVRAQKGKGSYVRKSKHKERY